MIVDLNKKQNEITDLADLESTRYENIFNLGTRDNYYFFNIIKTVKFPENLNPELYYTKIITGKKPYTAISFEFYGTQNLWWLILLSNNITNPVDVITPGTRLKIIKREYINDVIQSIKNLNNA